MTTAKKATKLRKIKYIGIVLTMAMLTAGCGQKAQTETTIAEIKASEESLHLEIEATEDSESKETAKGKVSEQIESGQEQAESSEETTTSAQESTEESAQESTEAVESTAEEESTEPSESTVEESTALSESTSEQSAETESAVSVDKIYENISSQVTLHSMVSMPDDFITNYYGVDTSVLDEYVFAMSEDATSAETVIVMKTKDTSKVDGLTTALQMVIDEKKAEMQNYLPEQYEIVSKSEVKVSGSYVYLVISEQADTITNIIEEEIQ